MDEAAKEHGARVAAIEAAHAAALARALSAEASSFLRAQEAARLELTSLRADVDALLSRRRLPGP